MAANTRRKPMSRSGVDLSVKATMLPKGASFSSPTPPSSPETEFHPPTLSRRSQSNLDDTIEACRRRVSLLLCDMDKAYAASEEGSSLAHIDLRDTSLPVPRGVLCHTIDSSIMGKAPEVARRVQRPRQPNVSRFHKSDSGLGTSITSKADDKADEKASASMPEARPVETAATKTSTKSTAVIRCGGSGEKSILSFPPLSSRATSRIYEHTLKPLLADPSLREFHPLVLESPRRIQEKEIVCLRDLEKTLLLLAPERTKSAKLYMDFCMTTVRCVQATVEYLSDREQTRPRDVPYSPGYFVDLVDQIHRYAQQLADAKEKGEVDVTVHDEIKLHGGIHVNGRPAELVRVRKDGQMISMATGKLIDAIDEEEGSGAFKRSASEQLLDEEEIMRSMARRKKNASPEELAPKKCREPGCNKMFKRPCDLTKHEKTHSRPWKCPVVTCKYHEFGWPTEKEMDRHHNDKHSSAPPMYECLFRPCPYKSKRESNCKQHMEKAHGWEYVRTKTNRKKSSTGSIPGHPDSTPALVNLPTPLSDRSMGVVTPSPSSEEWGQRFSDIEFPAYLPQEADFRMIPQELAIVGSPVDVPTPSSDSSADHSSAYRDIGNDFTMYEDIYGAHVQVPAPHIPQAYMKRPLSPSLSPGAQYAAYAAVNESCANQPAHPSPVSQHNGVVYTPSSMAEEQFDNSAELMALAGRLPTERLPSDFVLFPQNMVSKPAFPPPSAYVPCGFENVGMPHRQPNPMMAQGFDMGWNPGFNMLMHQQQHQAHHIHHAPRHSR